MPELLRSHCWGWKPRFFFNKYQKLIRNVNYLISRWDFNQGNSSRHILIFSNPIGQDIFSWAPTEISHAIDFDTFSVQKSERGGFINAQSWFLLVICGYSGEKFVVWRPFENRPRTTSCNGEHSFFHPRSGFPNNHRSNFFD